jgi:hypothetical protein
MQPIPGQRNFYAESVAECRRAGITDQATRVRVEFKLRSDMYWEINKPWMDIITLVHATRVRPPRLILNADGSIKQVQPDWTAREQQLLDDARQGLEWCAAQCGLTLEPRESTNPRVAP